MKIFRNFSKKVSLAKKTLIRDIRKDIYTKFVSTITACVIMLIGAAVFGLYLHFAFGINFTTSLTQQALYQQIFHDKPENFKVVDTKEVDFYGDGHKATVVLLEPNNRGTPLDSTEPRQLLIYERTGSKYVLATKIAPTFSGKEENFPPTFLDFMSMEPIYISGFSKREALLTRWGITGADFWGGFPLIITRKEGQYNFSSAFPEELKEPGILKEKYSLMNLNVYDAFNSERKIQTMGTQDYLQKGDSLLAVFVSTVNCHACNNQHRVDIYTARDDDGVIYDYRSKKNLFYLDPEIDVNEFIKKIEPTEHKDWVQILEDIKKKTGVH